MIRTVVVVVVVYCFIRDCILYMMQKGVEIRGFKPKIGRQVNQSKSDFREREREREDLVKRRKKFNRNERFFLLLCVRFRQYHNCFFVYQSQRERENRER